MSIPEDASAGSGVGVIAGVCKGVISDCGVTFGEITNLVTSSYTGGMVGTLRNGTIINSFVKNSNITTTDASVGGIVGKIETGDILNCFSASNTITRSNNYSGGFCGRADNGNIINSYVYKLIFKDNINTGQFIGHGINSNATECFTDTGTDIYNLIKEKDNCTYTPNYKYKSDFTNSQGAVYKLLNQWIKANQSSYNHPFTQWTEDKTGNLPAIFQ